MITIESFLLFGLMLGLLLVMVLQLNNLNSIRKHNLVLYKLRATHDKTLLFLVDNVDNQSISNNEKLEIRYALDKLDGFIAFFGTAKKRLTFKLLMSVLLSKKSLPFAAEQVDDAISPVLAKVRFDLIGAILFAFSEYVPFFKFRITLKVFSLVSEFLLMSGIKRLLVRFDTLMEYKRAIDFYRQVDDNYQHYQSCEV